MHLARNTILHLLEIIGLDESSPYLINKLKDERIEKEELKKIQQQQHGKNSTLMLLRSICYWYYLSLLVWKNFTRGSGDFPLG